MNKIRASILLVEDNPADIEITRQALQAAEVQNDLHVICDGVTALRFLRRQEEFVEAPRPDLVLLDLNLPGKDGRTVLHEIKADAELCSMPVVILSSSSAPSDIRDAYRLHANSYVTKPIDFPEFVELLVGVCEYWFKLVTLQRGP